MISWQIQGISVQNHFPPELCTHCLVIFLASCMATEHSAISLILAYCKQLFLSLNSQDFLFTFAQRFHKHVPMSVSFSICFNFPPSLSSLYSYQKILLVLIFLAHFSSIFFTSFTTIRQILNILDRSSISQQKGQPFSPSAVKKLLIKANLAAVNGGTWIKRELASWA